MVQHEFHLVDSLQTDLTLRQCLAHGGHLFLVGSGKVDDGLQFLDGILGKPVGTKLFIDLLKTNLVQLVNCHSDVHNAVCLANHLRNARQNLSVVYLDADPDAETVEHSIHNLHQFHLVNQAVRTHHIGIALIKLAITALLRTVCTPHGLNLITAERKGQLITVLHHIARKGDCKVIAQTLFA